MKININNYEEYFIDYFDGKLSAEDVAELFLFLENETKLKEEFESFSPVSLDAGDESFPFRDALKRGEINRHNFDWYLAASFEGDLSAAEEKQLQHYIQNNTEALKQQQIMQRTRLHPGSEKFPGKNDLRQTVPFTLFSRQNINYAIAAMLFLSIIAGSYFVFTRTQNTPDQRVAQLPVEKQIDQKQTEKSTGIFENETPSPTQQHLPKSDINLAQKSIPKRKTDVKSVDNKDTVPAIEIEDPVFDNKVQMAESIRPENIPVKTPEAVLAVSDQPFLASSPKSAVTEEKYMTVWEALREASVNKIKNSNGDDVEALASASGDNGIKLMDVVGKGLNILSNDKVKLETHYNKEERNSSFKFSAGKLLKIEKN